MNEKINNSIRIWLKGGFFLVGMMLLLGGATRLTGSGLSMGTWDVFSGILPHLDTQSWEMFFTLYKKSPEYLKINFTMDLEGFKKIFWLEYVHRVLGRVLGLYFLIPLFLKQKRLMIGFVLVCAQGLLGWLMVASGLKNVPHVNPFFLSAHLMMAAVLILWMVWEYKDRKPLPYFYISILLIEIFLGGLVAGFKAGLIYNTFPLMDGMWVPEGIFEGANILMTPQGVQWIHRVWSVAVLVSFLRLSLICRNIYIFLCLIVQIFLGILTIIWHIPLIIALLHQLNAFLLLGFAGFCNYLKKN